MATLTIRDVPDAVRDRIRIAAARKGASMEAELRRLIVETYAEAETERAKLLQEKLAEARRIVRSRIPEGYPLVDEFLAERRAMWGEED